ncbi:thermosome subunit [Candidatus Woesearchaeota archaeon B3_Woes]|nr:MAG: thermosome subunit [Candidatus Woesearchaeota archaeon B3_Woes]
MADNNSNIQPVFIMPEGTQRSQGRQAQRMNIMAAKLVAETVRTTLGPKGMDKMITGMGDITVTNDGVTILEEMQIEHPAAKMIVEIAKTQEEEVGDGTTTAVVIAGELLKNAEGLIEQDVHPTVVARGYRLAESKSQKILNEMAENVSIKDVQTLNKIAMTAMTGKGAENAKEKLADITVKSIITISEQDGDKILIDKDNIKIEKKVGSSVEDSELIKGIVLDKERVHSGMPQKIENAKIALVDSAIEIKSTEMDAKIQITDPSQMQAFLDQEEGMLKQKVKKIVDSGANVLICQKGIDDLAQHFLAKHGIYAVRRSKQSDMVALSKATGGKIVTNLEDLNGNDLGKAGFVEDVKVGDENMTYIKECKNPKSVTLLIRGGTEHVVDEVKRAVTDAVGDVAAALKNGKVVAGAGSPELELSKGLMKYANSLSGREQLAVEAFAKSMEVIPRTLAENAGIDSIDSLTELKAAHDKKNKWAGIDVFTGKTMDAWKEGVIEPLKIKTQAIASASEVAVMILRIDDVIEGGKVGPEMGGGMPPGMPPGMPGMM